MNKTVADITLLIGVFLAVGLMVYIIIIANSEGYQCQSNPLVYGAKKLSEVNKAEFIGTGTFLKPNSPSLTFDSRGLNVTLPKSMTESVSEQYYRDLSKNISLINVTSFPQ